MSALVPGCETTTVAPPSDTGRPESVTWRVPPAGTSVASEVCPGIAAVTWIGCEPRFRTTKVRRSKQRYHVVRASRLAPTTASSHRTIRDAPLLACTAGDSVIRLAITQHLIGPSRT